MLKIRQEQLDALAAARRQSLVDDVVRRARQSNAALEEMAREELTDQASRILDRAPSFGLVVLEHQLRFTQLFVGAENALQSPEVLAILRQKKTSGAVRLDRVAAWLQER